MRTHARIVIAHHLILTLYGHWPPNDPRGSGSEEIRKESLEQLGEIHHGRKPEHLQPSRSELRSFHKQVEPLLDHPVFWIDDAKRQAIAGAIAEVVREQRYTCYACAICSNHLHLIIRRHRDDALTILRHIMQKSAEQLRLFAPPTQAITPPHPIWADRPYKVFLYTPDEVRTRIRYVEANPLKEGLAAQQFPFITPYNNWPLHNKK